MPSSDNEIVWFEDFGLHDIGRVGGKNASLGEMVRNLAKQGVKIPPGFSLTADAYRRFLEFNQLNPTIAAALADFHRGSATVAEVGQDIRRAILHGSWPDETAAQIRSAYRRLCERTGAIDADVAVRSSATAEDLPNASFAGQLESFLNVRGEDALLSACRRCYASLFTDRAIIYRSTKNFDHMKLALSVGVQRMVRSDRGSAGVMFSIDTETGFDKVVLIDASWGLGENVVQGSVDPDEYQIYKPFLSDDKLEPIIAKKLGGKQQKLIYSDTAADAPTLNVPTSQDERESFVLQDSEILALSRWACIIETHYGQPMDMEWAKDGQSGELFIVQARPETVQSRREANAFHSYTLKTKGQCLTKGLALGDAIITGKVCLIDDPHDVDRFVDGAILVTSTTDPDWLPIMARAAGLVTDHGGRTSHAAIVSRELGLPAIVGTGDATRILHDRQEITVSCAEGDQGFVYDGKAEFNVRSLRIDDIPSTRTKIMLNLANPAAAFRWWRLPTDGVGLARMEFVISNHIKIHPMALVQYDQLAPGATKQEIADLTRGYSDKTQYFVDRLAQGLARIAAAHFPNPVIVRMSDFKSNEYRDLIGGVQFEPQEENPMLGFRGASRYYSPQYRAGFTLECRAIHRLRQTMGFRNVIVMIPFCRSPAEADKVLAVMAANDLSRGKDDLEIYVMCEIPSNVVLAEAFARRFDGFSIGSNDLTQLTLGVDRDSSMLAPLFDEQDEAVKWMISHVISAARVSKTKVGLCGQAPSDHPAFAAFLVSCGINSISVSPDSFIAVKQSVANSEAQMRETTAT